jgi:hypothetical protein
MLDSHLQEKSQDHVYLLNQKVSELKQLLVSVTNISLQNHLESSIPLKKVLKLLETDRKDLNSLFGDLEKRKRGVEALILEFGRFSF